MSVQQGMLAEEIARCYLESQGLSHCMSNYRSRSGEIDLVMRDGEYWVFVEVRQRTSARFGNALESVTYFKQQKLIKTAHFFMLSRKIGLNSPSRFDVVGLQGNPPTMSWIKNAFGAYAL